MTRVFGHIPGIVVGTIFANRKVLHDAGVHKPPEHGISGSMKEGADSIVVSGGYEDDEDYGNVIIYTGAGGNDPSSHKQIADQTLTDQNLALAKNRILGLPVRVVRKVKEGFRYDGLFWVEGVSQKKGKSGFNVALFRLVSDSAMQSAQSVLFPEQHVQPSRRETTSWRIIRNSEAARRVKNIYDFKCQVCGEALRVPEGIYAEGAHIRPLGRLHNGPDSTDNILCLCPNHHVLLDYGAITIQDDLTLMGMPGKLNVDSSHRLDRAHLRYHREHVFSSQANVPEARNEKGRRTVKS